MLLEWFWRSRTERKGDPKVDFSFPGGSLRDGWCFVELVLVFPVRWPWAGLGSAACPCLSQDDVGQRTAVGAWGPGFFWQIPWCWSSLSEAPLLFFSPHHLFVLMQGKGPDPQGKGRQLLCIS